MKKSVDFLILDLIGDTEKLNLIFKHLFHYFEERSLFERKEERSFSERFLFPKCNSFCHFFIAEGKGEKERERKRVEKPSSGRRGDVVGEERRRGRRRRGGARL